MNANNLIMDFDTTMKRAAIYTRVSTTEQADEGYSIDEQERLAIEYCEKQGWVVHHCYSDRGISGKNITARPGVQRLLKDVKSSM